MSSYLPAPCPELYTLNLIIEEFTHRNSVYKDFSMRLFKQYEKELELDYSALIKAPQPSEASESWGDYQYAKDFINADLFTREEVEAIRTYFAPDLDVTLKAKPYTDFPVCNTMSIGAVAVGGYSDFWMFDKAEGFDCPVRFWGFYDVDGYQKLANIIKVHCRPSGLVVFEGRHGFTLTSQDVDVLRHALGKAVINEEVQTLKLRLPLAKGLTTPPWSEEDLPF